MSLAPAISKVISVICPQADAARWAGVLDAPMSASQITSAQRVAMFLGHCAEESREFSSTVESLYYTHADRIKAVWPEQFPPGDPTKYVEQPEALANYVYAGRNGNGDGPSGDGWLFRGRGLLQISGRTMYTDFAAAQADKTADGVANWLETPEGAAASAAWYWGWAYHGELNTKADQWDVRGATRIINGGYTNLTARIRYTGLALAVLRA